MTNSMFPQEQVTMLQQVSSSMVQVAVYSAFATAMATAMTTMGAAAATGAAPTDAVISDLRRTFGNRIVNQAVRNVGRDDVTALATEIDKLYVEQLKEKYGEHVANTALQAAPPLETKIVEDVARALSGQGVTPYTPAPKQEEVVKTSRSKSLRKNPPVPYLDKKTDIAYPSRASLYKAVAGEYGLNPRETLRAFELTNKLDPERFERMTQASFEAHTGERFLRKRDIR